MAKNSAATAPMDDTVQEVSGKGRVSTNNQRNVYALQTLIDEVRELFPETVVETSGYDGRNAAHDVTFTLDTGDAILADLLTRVDDDERVEEVIDDGDMQVLVSFHHNARLQDKRDPFGLSEAFDVLVETAEEGSL